MLQVLEKTNNTATVQFTGADLKKWYAEHGERQVFFCHVLERVVTNANVCRGKILMPHSHDLIDQFRELVPSRFKVNKSASTALTPHLRRRYVSKSGDNYGFHTRMNLLKYIPDVHVFTLTFE